VLFQCGAASFGGPARRPTRATAEPHAGICAEAVGGLAVLVRGRYTTDEGAVGNAWREYGTMTAPINATPEDPDTSDWLEDEIRRWEQEAAQWEELNPGNPDFYPLTVKAGYVIGVIYEICESVSCPLSNPVFARRTSYVPAYGILASAVEILGRCVTGESRSYRSTLRVHYRTLFETVGS
jgi:hypothetical protein